MRYIIALGNPGTQYLKTRHNVGWRAADAIVAEALLHAPRPAARYLGTISGGVWEGVPLTILYPTTFMNKSGEAARALVPTDKIPEMIVVHDEVALPLGKIRISEGSGPAGHNGVRSIIDSCGTNTFIRVRLGVGGPPVGIPLERFVLQPFLAEEEPVVAEMVTTAVAAVRTLLVEGVEAAMNRYNAETGA